MRRSRPALALIVGVILHCCSGVRGQGTGRAPCTPFYYGDGTVACGPGCTQVGNKCAQCADALCKQCDSGAATCGACALFVSELVPSVAPASDVPVYRSASGKCSKCTAHPVSSGCQRCNSGGRCVACRAGHVLVEGACRKCGGGAWCKECGPDLACQACAPGYGFNSEGICQKCSEPNCSACATDHTKCTACVSQGTWRWYLDTQGRCKQAPEACMAASPSGACLRCERGFGKSNGGRSCQRCLDPTCLSCPDSPGVCTECFTGKYVDPSTKRCADCGPGCASCRDARTCTKCFFLSLVVGSCRRCDDPRCADCTGNTEVCRECKRPAAYEPHPTTGRCVRKEPAAGGRRLQAEAGLQDAGAAIVNGQDAQPGRHPYMASLRQRIDGQKSWHFCGATLVHERVLLTAAHCLVEEVTEDWHQEDVAFPLVWVGGYQREGESGQEVLAGRWPLVHEQYTSGFASQTPPEFDVALVLLDRPASKRPLMSLATRLPPVATNLSAIGWGLTDRAHKVLPEALQEVDLDLLPLKTCQASYGQKFPSLDWSGSSMLCAGTPAERQGGCQGDSGGPLIQKGATPAQDKQLGITSWGIGCASGQYPDVYTDVPKVAVWIQRGIRRLLAEAARQDAAEGRR